MNHNALSQSGPVTLEKGLFSPSTRAVPLPSSHCVLSACQHATAGLRGLPRELDGVVVADVASCGTRSYHSLQGPLERAFNAQTR